MPSLGAELGRAKGSRSQAYSEFNCASFPYYNHNIIHVLPILPAYPLIETLSSLVVVRGSNALDHCPRLVEDVQNLLGERTLLEIDEVLK